MRYSVRFVLATVLPFVGGLASAATEDWRMTQLGGFPEHDRVAAMPIVIPYTDDNGDGRIDALDGGDVIVIGGASIIDSTGMLRVLEGHDGHDLRTFDALPSGGNITGVVTPAAGDIDG